MRLHPADREDREALLGSIATMLYEAGRAPGGRSILRDEFALHDGDDPQPIALIRHEA